MKIIALTASLAAMAAAEVDVMGILACQTEYSAYDGDNDCDALVTLAKCFANAGVDQLSVSDATRRMADDFLTGQQSKAKCFQYEQEGSPAINVNDGHLEIDVDGEKDIRIVRYLKDTVSLFDLSEDIKGMEAYQKDTLPGKLAAATASAQEAATQTGKNAAKIANEYADDLNAMAGAVEDASASLAAKIASMETNAQNQRNAIKSDMEKSIKNGIASSKAAATSQLSRQASSDTSKFS